MPICAHKSSLKNVDVRGLMKYVCIFIHVYLFVSTNVYIYLLYVGVYIRVSENVIMITH